MSHPFAHMSNYLFKRKSSYKYCKKFEYIYKFAKYLVFTTSSYKQSTCILTATGDNLKFISAISQTPDI